MIKEEALYDVHQNHVEWQNKLKFYNDEIKIFNKRLVKMFFQRLKNIKINLLFKIITLMKLLTSLPLTKKNYKMK